MRRLERDRLAIENSFETAFNLPEQEQEDQSNNN